jgi:hypothetical protein
MLLYKLISSIVSRTTNNEQRTSNNEQRKTNNEHRTMNNEQRTTNNEQRTTDNEQRTSNNENKVNVISIERSMSDEKSNEKFREKFVCLYFFKYAPLFYRFKKTYGLLIMTPL